MDINGSKEVNPPTCQINVDSEQSCLDNKRVAVAFTGLQSYPAECPFDPPEPYPEYRLGSLDPKNKVYSWVREVLYRLGLDKERFNSPEWNPLGEIVVPGMTVVIKPNTVLHEHLAGKDIFSMIVHASVLRPILDYVSLALRGRGRIIVGDAQQIFGRFDEAMAVSGIGPLLEWYRGRTAVDIECMDFRQERGVYSWKLGPWGREPVQADPRGYREVDLGRESNFHGIQADKLRISVASHKEIYHYHSGGRHAYLFPRSVLEGDAIINIAKLKTHRRTGVSLTLKNLMGFVSTKGCLPHFRVGSPQEGGDEYIYPSWRKRVHTRLQDWMMLRSSSTPIKFACAVGRRVLWGSRWIVPFRDIVNEAMWYGNDTLWRLVLDINRAALFADKDGKLRGTVQRRYLCLLDGIVAGEKNGPLSPDPVTPGVLLAGTNPVAVDTVAASLMGFDVDKIPMIRKAFGVTDAAGVLYQGIRGDIEVVEGKAGRSLAEFIKRRNLRFEPHANWKGHIEREG